jgi:putative aminopeptidase
MIRRATLLILSVLFSFAPSGFAQSTASRHITDSWPGAVSGYESQFALKICDHLRSAHPVIDNLGDVFITFGTGSPHRLIVTPMDTPGFVVSGITDDGYLRLQRLPQFGPPPIFNQLYFAQPVEVRTSSGKWISGVIPGLSVHLLPGRTDAPKSSDLENIFVDIGATSAAEIQRAGVDLLSPVALSSRPMDLSARFEAGPGVGDHFGVEALLQILTQIDPRKIQGTLTFAFVVQQHTGARGLERILTTIPADEMIYVGPLLPGGSVEGVENMHRAPRRSPGSGVLVGLESTTGTLEGLPADLANLASTAKIPFIADYSSSILPRGDLPLPPLPAKWAHIGISVDWADTPAQEISSADQSQLAELLGLYSENRRMSGSSGAVGSGKESSGVGIGNRSPAVTELLRILTETYGVSGQEGPVREEVKRLLPPWAKPDTDPAGNLILPLGVAPVGSHSPRILIVAHLDEIGFTVKSVSEDGRLEVSSDGGEDLSFYLGHPALVHSRNGDHNAIMELPGNWDRPDFAWPGGRSSTNFSVDIGARSSEEAEQLGVQPGDTVTIPKIYRPLLGSRANARSFDDRVGDSALISAVWSLGGPLQDRDVTFVWSTGEELGLVGAAQLARRLSEEGHTPDYVFAVDTFVSSDSPLESKRFAYARLGGGFVIRAVDNSNIVRSDLVEKVVKLARANQIPVQYGVTGGGNDGSAFLRYGSVDIALGWPLRYSHSPAEVIDTRDAESLARIVAVIAKSW